jgi:hypothetical protein
MTPGLIAALCCALVSAPSPFAQDWSDTGLITVDDDWSQVPAIVGHRGDGLADGPGADPRTILADGSTTPVDVAANRTDPGALGVAAGVAEFELEDPVVAIQGSATASAPHLVIALDTRGRTGITVGLDLRDIDGSAADAVEPVAVQYRIGSAGEFANAPGGYLADATTGPGEATAVTRALTVLPAAVDDQPLVQVRVITTDAAGRDEWVGVDDIEVSATAAAPGGCGGEHPAPGPGPEPLPEQLPVPVPEPLPGSMPAPQPSPAPDDARKRPPELTGLALVPQTFIPARRGPAIARRGRAGTGLRFRLSKAALVRFQVTPGPERLRFQVRGRRGLNRMRFSGRIRGRALAEGRYTLAAVAVNRAGRASAPTTFRFGIGAHRRIGADARIRADARIGADPRIGADSRIGGDRR